MDIIKESYNAKVDCPVRLYKMQPGDATRYNFFFSPLPEGSGEVLPGVGLTGAGYTLLGIYMPGGCGVAIADDYELRNPAPHHIGYLQSHGMGAVHTWSLAAVLMAMSVLIDNPDDLEGAAEAMLQASSLLR